LALLGSTTQSNPNVIATSIFTHFYDWGLDFGYFFRYYFIMEKCASL